MTLPGSAVRTVAPAKSGNAQRMYGIPVDRSKYITSRGGLFSGVLLLLNTSNAKRSKSSSTTRRQLKNPQQHLRQAVVVVVLVQYCRSPIDPSDQAELMADICWRGEQSVRFSFFFFFSGQCPKIGTPGHLVAENG